MGYEQRDNSGILFRNDRKKPGDKSPDYKGKCKVNGVELDMAAWLRDGKKGKFMTFSFQPPRQVQSQGMGEYGGEPESRPAPPPARRPAPPPSETPDDDYPF